jgi:hypothetical protein
MFFDMDKARHPAGGKFIAETERVGERSHGGSSPVNSQWHLGLFHSLMMDD